MKPTIRFIDIPAEIVSINIIWLILAIEMVRERLLESYTSRPRNGFDIQQYESKKSTVGAWGIMGMIICVVTMVLIWTYYRTVTAFSEPAQFYAWMMLAAVAFSLVLKTRYKIHEFFSGFAVIVSLFFTVLVGIAISISLYGDTLFSFLSAPLAGQTVPVVSIAWVSLFYFSGGGMAETAFFQLFLYESFAQLLSPLGGWGLFIASQLVAGIFVVYHFGVQLFFPNLWATAGLPTWEFFLEAYIACNLFNLMMQVTKRYDYIAYVHGSYDVFWTVLQFYAPTVQAGVKLGGF